MLYFYLQQKGLSVIIKMSDVDRENKTSIMAVIKFTESKFYRLSNYNGVYMNNK